MASSKGIAVGMGCKKCFHVLRQWLQHHHLQRPQSNPRFQAFGIRYYAAVTTNPNEPTRTNQPERTALESIDCPPCHCKQWWRQMPHILDAVLPIFWRICLVTRVRNAVNQWCYNNANVNTTPIGRLHALSPATIRFGVLPTLTAHSSK
jgi:hypothetical protein